MCVVEHDRVDLLRASGFSHAQLQIARDPLWRPSEIDCDWHPQVDAAILACHARRWVTTKARHDIISDLDAVGRDAKGSGFDKHNPPDSLANIN